jgi:hypothetical protein
MRRTGLVLLAIVLSACAAPEQAGNNRDTMTQRQKDSVLAQSGLPGARAVGMAQAQADSAKARQAKLDSASQP